MAWFPQCCSMKKMIFINHVPKLLNWVIFDFTLSPWEDISVIDEFLVNYLISPAVEADKLKLVFFSFNDADEITFYYRLFIFNEPMQQIILRCNAERFDIFNFHLNKLVRNAFFNIKVKCTKYEISILRSQKYTSAALPQKFIYWNFTWFIILTSIIWSEIFDFPLIEFSSFDFKFNKVNAWSFILFRRQPEY